MSPDPEPTHTSFSSESYFETQPPPATLQEDVARVREFVRRQKEQGRKVVLVTSGGTTVPLELNVVRFLDNFSAGTRGSTSAEYFLKAGYAVIFMHRQFSLQPFSRHYSHSTNPFLDFLEIDPPLPSSQITTTSSHPSPPSPQILSQTQPIKINPPSLPDLLQVLTAYKTVQALGTLHTLTFVTVNDYLWLLRAVSQELSVMGREGMYYLAAAVSDFFLPREKVSEHKIQSGKGSLHIEMDQVPKILKPMVDEWTREGFIVSFKLETDSGLLIPKACAALERYGHQVVIGNDLHRRKWEVVFVSRRDLSISSLSSSTPTAPSAARTPIQEDKYETPDGFETNWLRIDSNPARTTAHVKEIEEDIVAELVRRHDAWIDAAAEVVGQVEEQEGKKAGRLLLL